MSSLTPPDGLLEQARAQFSRHKGSLQDRSYLSLAKTYQGRTYHILVLKSDRGEITTHVKTDRVALASLIPEGYEDVDTCQPLTLFGPEVWDLESAFREDFYGKGFFVSREIQSSVLEKLGLPMGEFFHSVYQPETSLLVTPRITYTLPSSLCTEKVHAIVFQTNEKDVRVAGFERAAMSERFRHTLKREGYFQVGVDVKECHDDYLKLKMPKEFKRDPHTPGYLILRDREERWIIGVYKDKRSQPLYLECAQARLASQLAQNLLHQGYSTLQPPLLSRESWSSIFGDSCRKILDTTHLGRQPQIPLEQFTTEKGVEVVLRVQNRTDQTCSTLFASEIDIRSFEKILLGKHSKFRLIEA